MKDTNRQVNWRQQWNDIDQLMGWGKESQASKHYIHGDYFPLPVSMAAFIRRSRLPYGLPSSWCGGEKDKDRNCLFIGNQREYGAWKCGPDTRSVNISKSHSRDLKLVPREDWRWPPWKHRAHRLCPSGCGSGRARTWALGHTDSIPHCLPGGTSNAQAAYRPFIGFPLGSHEAGRSAWAHWI